MSNLNNARGFSMLEVLVTMLVIMIGALGIAGMQLLAITSTENARYQNVATMLTGSLTANMQANVAYWGTPPPSVTIVGTTITGGPAAFTGTCVGLASTCNTTQVAAYDLRIWAAQVSTLLPGGGATITCPAGNNPAICTLQVFWLERNVTLQNETNASATNIMASGRRQENSFQTLVSIL